LRKVVGTYFGFLWWVRVRRRKNQAVRIRRRARIDATTAITVLEGGPEFFAAGIAVADGEGDVVVNAEGKLPNVVLDRGGFVADITALVNEGGLEVVAPAADEVCLCSNKCMMATSCTQP